MLNNKTIAVVVPAFNEAKQIGMVIDSMPGFVDRIIIVNDGSTDTTAGIVQHYLENDTSPVIEIKDILNQVHLKKYNRADFTVQEALKTELKNFIPSVVVNKNPEKARVILINQLKNGGVGAAIARGRNGRRRTNGPG
jgi:glycosyltransferase involved in cell wall biosynthesis